MTIQHEAQKLSGNSYIELYTLDATNIGGSIYHFTPSLLNEGQIYVSFGGVHYYSVPVQATGFEVNSNGSQAKPQISFSNVSRDLMSAVVSLGDLVGAKLTLTRTFTCFLDGQPTADSTQYFPIETFYIDQKKQHDNQVIAWQLTSAIDRFDLMIPRRQVTRYTGFPGVGGAR